MLVETQIEILDGHSSYLFSNEPFEKRPGTTMEDFGLHSDDHFVSSLIFSGTRCMTLSLFSNEPFEKRPRMTIEDFGLHSDDHFVSSLIFSETGCVTLRHLVIDFLEHRVHERVRDRVCDTYTGHRHVESFSTGLKPLEKDSTCL